MALYNSERCSSVVISSPASEAMDPKGQIMVTLQNRSTVMATAYNGEHEQRRAGPLIKRKDNKLAGGEGLSLAVVRFGQA